MAKITDPGVTDPCLDWQERAFAAEREYADLRHQLEQLRAALSIFAASDHWGQLVIKGKRKFLWVTAFDPIECAVKALKGG